MKQVDEKTISYRDHIMIINQIFEEHDRHIAVYKKEATELKRKLRTYESSSEKYAEMLVNILCETLSS